MYKNEKIFKVVPDNFKFQIRDRDRYFEIRVGDKYAVCRNCGKAKIFNYQPDYFMDCPCTLNLSAMNILPNMPEN